MAVGVLGLVHSYFKIVPLAPTAYPCCESAKYTEFKFCVVPLVVVLQFAPSKCKIVPYSPTAYPFVFEIK